MLITDTGCKIDRQNNIVDMKALKFSLNRLLVIVLLFLTCRSGNSQESQSKIVKRKGMFLEVNYGTIQSLILNKGILSLSELKSAKQNSFMGSFEFGYFFSPSFGMSAGIGYTSYKTRLSLNSYENKFNTTDSEKELYELRISASGLKEDQKIDFLNIPYLLEYPDTAKQYNWIIYSAGCQHSFSHQQNL